MSSSGRCFGNGRNGRPQVSSFVPAVYAERGLPSVRAITGAFDPSLRAAKAAENPLLRLMMAATTSKLAAGELHPILRLLFSKQRGYRAHNRVLSPTCNLAAVGRLRRVAY